MSHEQNTYRPPISDLWLVVDEQQTLHFGLRQAWRWLESDKPVQRRPPNALPMHGAHCYAAEYAACCG
jgi:hypothetical protein